MAAHHAPLRVVRRVSRPNFGDWFDDNSVDDTGATSGSGDWFDSNSVDPTSGGSSMDPSTSTFTDADGNVYSQAEMDALADGGDTSGWSATDLQLLVDSVNQDNAEAAATGQSVSAVKANNAAAASNPIFSTVLSALGVAGPAGIAWIKANPGSVPSFLLPVAQQIPGFSTTPYPKVTGKATASNSSTLLIAVGIGLAAVVALLLTRKQG